MEKNITDHHTFLRALESGDIRAASQSNAEWKVNLSVKEHILEVFRDTEIVEMPGGFQDKSLLNTQKFQRHSHVRLVPGGSAVRAGAYIGEHVVIMPPSYVNIGAYIDHHTMVDSHVLVGSCAQIGARVHLSAAVQIGGVLEPVGSRPVIVEEDCFIGAGVVLTEGILVRKGAVIAPGVVLSASVPIYDTIRKQIYKKEIPEGAVIVPGTRSPQNTWAMDQNLQVSCAIIVKYRDSQTSAALSLEEALRS